MKDNLPEESAGALLIRTMTAEVIASASTNRIGRGIDEGS